ncbi:MAG: BatD family protein [Campylobacterales bacterium]|nr:BatD family protein [Campylobacterales bacterium]
MKNLGKIALFLLLVPYALFGGVTATVDSKSVELGNTVTLSLDITGDNATRPNLNTLCGSDIISANTSTSIQGVNGVYKKSIILSYKFLPQKSCEIEAVNIDIDGKIESTEPIKIEVKPVDRAKDSDFVLSLESNKKEIFVGEPFDLTLLFRQKRNTEAVDSKFSPPDLKGFWVKGESKPTREDDGEYITTKVIYTMSPQREGNLKISGAQMSVASRSNSRDSWGSWIPAIKWKSYFSNEVELNVKPLPVGVSLVGKFTISATVDKSEINANEAVNVTVEVQGDGNLEDIKTFKPNIDKVSIFDEKIVIEKSKLSQKMAFVSDEDFVIPPFELKYFDTLTKEIQSVSTKEIHVKVKNAKPKEELLIKRDENAKAVQTENSANISINEISIYWVVLGFIVGLACGVLIAMLKLWKMIGKKRSSSLNEPRTLLVKLMPYKHDAEVQNLIEILEKNIYQKENIKIDTKNLKEILKRYEIV